MGSKMPGASGRIWLRFGILAVVSATINSFMWASNARSFTAAQYRRVFDALSAYNDNYKKFPNNRTAIEEGLEFSWRVHVLPFVEVRVPNQVLTAKDWNEPAIEHFRSEISHPFRHWIDEPNSVIILSRVLAPGSVFGDGKKTARFPRDYKPEHFAQHLWLVERSARNGSNWMKPGDWVFDPTNPHSGLPEYLWNGPTRARGCFGIFGDGTIRFVSSDVPDDILSDVASPPRDRPIKWQLSFVEAFFAPGIGQGVRPFVGLSAIGVIAGAIVVLRILLGGKVQPGEIAMLGLAAYFVASLVAFHVSYRYEYFPLALQTGDHVSFWGWPLVAQNLSMLFGAAFFYSQRRWAVFYAAIHLITFVFVIPSLTGMQYQWYSPEESMMSHAVPRYFFVLGLVAIGLSLTERPLRPWTHWVALIGFFVPMAWEFAFPAISGWEAWPRSLYERILE